MTLRTALLATLALGCAACADSSKPAHAPDASPPPPTAAEPTRPANLGRAAASSAGERVAIDERIKALCQLPSEHFDFDSAQLSPAAAKLLAAVAECFETGPGRGKSLAVVGHADPRGDEDYNFALGQQRAGTVASYLRRAGLDERRVTASSRGEVDAYGRDEKGWAYDRRVDITLAP